MVRGRLNKQIAFQLGTSERTIKAHRHMVMQKLDVQSFAEAVSMAERLGLLSPSASAGTREQGYTGTSTLRWPARENRLRPPVAPKDNISRTLPCVVWCAVDTHNAQVCPVTNDCWIATAVETSSRRGGRTSRLVQRAEALALASVDEPLHVSALCSIIGVSERALRKAFHRVHGTPPCRHLRMLRLSNARRPLLSADRTLDNVT
jgi:hypothetical protein